MQRWRANQDDARLVVFETLFSWAILPVTMFRSLGVVRFSGHDTRPGHQSLIPLQFGRARKPPDDLFAPRFT